MSAVKKTAVYLLAALVIAGALGLLYYMNNWPLRFKNDLDLYFGEGNWQWISQDETEDYRYNIYHRIPNNPAHVNPKPGRFRNWYIAFEDPQGEKWLWRMTDHVYKINMHHRGAVSGFSARDGVTAELMDLSFRQGAMGISKKVLSPILSQEELNCLKVVVSYRGGNPGPSLFEKLRKQPWFRCGHAKEFFTWDYHDFYLDIYPNNHRADRLAPEIRDHLLGSLGRIETDLQIYLGEYCDYKVHLGQDNLGSPVRNEYPGH